jgi:hypothetical protein
MREAAQHDGANLAEPVLCEDDRERILPGAFLDDGEAVRRG